MIDERDQMQTVDCTPTWKGILPLYLAIIANSGTVTPEVRAELGRMAEAADKWGDLQRANRDAIEKVMS